MWGFLNLDFLSSKLLLNHGLIYTHTHTHNWHLNYKKGEMGNWHVKIIPNYNIHPTSSFFLACQIKQQTGHHNHFSNFSQIQFPCSRSLIIPSIIWDSHLYSRWHFLTLKSPSFKSKQFIQTYLYLYSNRWLIDVYNVQSTSSTTLPIS